LAAHEPVDDFAAWPNRAAPADLLEPLPRGNAGDLEGDSD